MEKTKRRLLAHTCKHFKSTGQPFGGCKNPKIAGACFNHFQDECEFSEKKTKDLTTP